MDLGISGQVALIVGGARGIGRATAELLAQEGAQVVIADIDGESAAQAASEIAAATGAIAVGHGIDVTDRDRVRDLATSIAADYGTISILVNCAALADDKLFLSSDPADWQRSIDINLFGTMNLLHCIVPQMVEHGYGRVICFASDSARVGQARLSFYAAAKGGVIALLKSVAMEESRNGVTFNVVSPGATNTDLRKRREAGLREQMGEEKYARRQKTVLKMYPAGRIGEPEDSAALVAFLASKQSSWITGQVISVNGGFIMP